MKMKRMFLAAIVVLFSGYSQANDVATASLGRAAVVLHKMHNQSVNEIGEVKPYQHQDEALNSLSRGALAKQGTKVKLKVTANSQISFRPKQNVNGTDASFFRAFYRGQY